MPGLIDAHGHYREFLPELLITYGVTTFMDTGNYMEYILAVRDATAAGKLWGPRVFTTGAGITGSAGGFNRDRVVVKNAEEARAAAKVHVARGVDFIKVYSGITADQLKAVTEVAHAAGIKVVGQLQVTNARDAVEAGIDGLVHASGVSASLVPPEDEKAIKTATGNPWGTPGSIVMHEAMDETRFDELIQLLVSRKVAIDPTLVYGAKGIMPDWDRIELECRRVLAEPELAYVPSEVSDNWCATNHLRGASDQELQRRRQGYDKMRRFLKKFADAGGVIVAGSDFVGSAIPGLTIHNEMATYVQDVGLTPMQAIQTATKNVADFYVPGKGLGTLKEGNLADLIIVRGDPLDDIRNTRNVEVVIKNGEILQTGFHRTYTNPYARPFPHRPVRRTTVTSVTPYVVTQGEPKETLTIKGSGFNQEMVVWVGHVPLKSSYVSETEFRAELSDRSVEFVGTVPVRVAAGPVDESIAQPGLLLVKHRLESKASPSSVN